MKISKKHVLELVAEHYSRSVRSLLAHECQLLSWVIIVNGDGNYGRQESNGGLTAQVGWPCLTVGGHLASMCIHRVNSLSERGEYSQR